MVGDVFPTKKLQMLLYQLDNYSVAISGWGYFPMHFPLMSGVSLNILFLKFIISVFVSDWNLFCR